MARPVSFPVFRHTHFALSFAKIVSLESWLTWVKINPKDVLPPPPFPLPQSVSVLGVLFCSCDASAAKFPQGVYAVHGASVFYAAGHKGGNAQQLNWRYSSVARGHSASAVVSCELLTKGLYYESEAYQ